MSLSDNINALVKIKKIKQDLPTLPDQKAVESVKGEDNSTEENNGAGIVSPVTFEVLTYDDALDVEVTTPTGTATIKTAETAQITDAEGTIIYIDEIIYADVP